MKPAAQCPHFRSEHKLCDSDKPLVRMPRSGRSHSELNEGGSLLLAACCELQGLNQRHYDRFRKLWQSAMAKDDFILMDLECKMMLQLHDSK